MFEQSMVMPAPASRWAMVSSLTVQVAAVGTLLLVPLIWVEQLPPIANLPPEVFAPRTLKPIQVFAEGVIRRTAAPVLERRAFTAPTYIPRVAQRIVDTSVFEELGDIAATGKGNNGVLESLFDSRQTIGTAAPPPAPQQPKPVSRSQRRLSR